MTLKLRFMVFSLTMEYSRIICRKKLGLLYFVIANILTKLHLIIILLLGLIDVVFWRWE